MLDLLRRLDLGWDTGFDQSAFDGQRQQLRRRLHPQDQRQLDLHLLGTVGDFGFRSDDEFGYEHTVIVDVKLTDKYEYVFSHDLVETDSPFGAIGNDEQDYRYRQLLVLHDQRLLEGRPACGMVEEQPGHRHRCLVLRS